tara:strand:- start:477 stop:1250 length:774 start_codon:yes stop_codon:yes gene_type:complete
MKINDNALEVFEAAIERAQRMSRLYHDLVDTRSRAMRSDWATSFEKFMKWPTGKALARIDGHEAIIVLKDGAELKSEDFSSDQMRDLLRASIMMGSSAMDAYFHRKIICYLVRFAKQGKSAPRELRTQQVSVQDFAKAIDRDRVWGELRRVFDRQLGYRSFISPGKITEGLNLIAVADFWEKTASRMSYEKGKLREHVEWIASRRNKIAHEGDLSTQKRNFGKTNALEPKDAVWALDFLGEFVNAADQEINDQLEAK